MYLMLGWASWCAHVLPVYLASTWFSAWLVFVVCAPGHVPPAILKMYNEARRPADRNIVINSFVARTAKYRDRVHFEDSGAVNHIFQPVCSRGEFGIVRAEVLVVGSFVSYM